MIKNKLNKLICLLIAMLLSVAVLSSCSIQLGSSNDDQDKLVVSYLDIGQGDSIFVELPNQQTMLIDAGVNDVGEKIINYIKGRGYSKIDYLVATHPHADHIGSTEYVVRHMDIGEIYMPKVSANTKTYEKLLESISKKGYKIKNAKSGDSIAEDEDLSVDILGPEKIDEDNLNNCSVIIKITYGNEKFLFIGDAEKDELKSIKADMSADVLKVGHHGSKTSTTKDFLKKVNPSYAVISCGKDNDYGHPHSSTIKLLNQFNVTYYRTDTSGTIKFIADKDSILDITTEK